MDTKIKTPESFQLDHINMSAPQVRKAGIETGPNGDCLSKFDLRFIKPNTEAIPTAALHTLEHLLATYLREHLDSVIDISPMGCRTGFYLLVWGDVTSEHIKVALLKSLQQIVKTQWADVPGTTASACGNYRDHSLFGAKEYAKQVIGGFELV